MEPKAEHTTSPPVPPTSSKASRSYWPWFLALVLGTASFIFIGRNEYVVCTPSNDVFTLDDYFARVQCISIRGDKVFDVGSKETLVRSVLPQRVVTLPTNAIIIPGLAVLTSFSDAHAHILENGLLKQLSLVGATSPKDVIRRVRNYVLAHPDILYNRTRWVQGMGWDQTRWTHQEFPTAEDLENDPVLVGRPIALRRVDGHAIWVSQAVLEEMGDLPPSKEPEGGQIIRDADGLPSGVFVDNAMNLVPIPQWTIDEMELFFQTTMKEALREAYWGDRVQKLFNYGKHGRLTMRSVKLFSDGALGSWGAALLEPYTDRPKSRGLLLVDKEKLEDKVNRLYKDGWQVNIHCIGDRANHIVLDIFENILEDDVDGTNVTNWRPRIEHAQIMTLDDLKRIGRLGVIASVQPTHATSDMWYAEIRLGSARTKGAYAYQTLLQSSPLRILPLGSDFPVESVNPLLGFYAAVSRLSVDGTSPHGPNGWYAQQSQRLTRAQALKGMTLDAAYASFNEKTLGSLTPGKKADFVVLDRNIMDEDGDPAEILAAKVLATVIDGEVAYGEI
ncbi:hypothetical protein BDN72DRAFT_869936 [Pluteus cervinus]|uniref:Uncharacterized protein n=1 Tax=Pluteus cervinus TaxID=181527 RepID=A0ACD3B1B0_9AGAR|nr:hypothetical protein BDN72DRAFT_869936 [Pluteus cervinus]